MDERSPLRPYIANNRDSDLGVGKARGEGANDYSLQLQQQTVAKICPCSLFLTPSLSPSSIACPAAISI